MAHDHHDHHHHHHSTSNIKVAFWLNLTFTVIECIGGLMTNSLSIISDALHDLGDSLALGMAWYFEKLSGKVKDDKYSYGYQRFSILGAIINSVVLIVGSIFIIQAAITRLFSPQVTDARGMFLLAILGIIINGIAYWRLKDGHNANEKVVSLHLLEDILGWVAVFIGSIIIYFTDWYIIDPLLSLGISMFILFNVFRNIKSSFKIIMQRIPENIRFPKIKELLSAIPNVRSVHDLHVWSLDGNKNILTVHLVIEEETSPDKIIEIKNLVKSKMLELDIDHCTLEFETPDEDCDLLDC